jgi:hypothetical protein
MKRRNTNLTLELLTAFRYMVSGNARCPLPQSFCQNYHTRPVNCNYDKLLSRRAPD